MAGYDGFVRVLIHSDNADDDTNIVDSSPYSANYTITPYGGISHQTEVAKFGASSLLCSATKYLYLVDSVDYTNLLFRTGDFTIDCWVRLNSIGSSQLYLAQGPSGGWYLQITSSGAFKFYGLGVGSWYATGKVAEVDTWYHVAIVRASGVLYFFVDGVKYNEWANTSDYNMSSANAIVQIGGKTSSAYPFTGYLDEVRISIGIGRWTSNFTPPDAPYDLDYINVDFVAPLARISTSPPEPLDFNFIQKVAKISSVVNNTIGINGSFIQPPAQISSNTGATGNFKQPLSEVNSVLVNPIAINVNYNSKLPTILSDAASGGAINVDYKVKSPVIKSVVDNSTYGDGIINANIITKSPEINSKLSVGSIIDVDFKQKVPALGSSIVLGTVINVNYKSYLPSISSDVYQEILINASISVTVPKISSSLIIPESVSTIKYDRNSQCHL